MKSFAINANELAAQIHISVTHVGEFTWRTKLATLFLRLARIAAPLVIDISESIGQPWLYYCPYCGHDFNNYYVPGRDHMTVLCPHCNRQSFVLIDEHGAHTVKEPAPCDFGCGYTEPFGFVPEADCPVHD